MKLFHWFFLMVVLVLFPAVSSLLHISILLFFSRFFFFYPSSLLRFLKIKSREENLIYVETICSIRQFSNKIVVKDNKTVSASSQTQQCIFILFFYLEHMFRPIQHHQTILTNLRIRYM